MGLLSYFCCILTNYRLIKFKSTFKMRIVFFSSKSVINSTKWQYDISSTISSSFTEIEFNIVTKRSV